MSETLDVAKHREIMDELEACRKLLARPVNIEWAMPSRWTFQIPPIAAFIDRWLPRDCVSVDPFCGRSTLATHSNDLALGGTDAETWCNGLADSGVVADVILFDPPYSPRQISECYRSIGLDVTRETTQNAALYKRVRIAADRLLRQGGIALSFGWSSAGFGKQYWTKEVLLVQHGGAHNDTICVAQQKPATRSTESDE